VCKYNEIYQDEYSIFMFNFFILPLRDKVEKYGTGLQAIADNIIRRMRPTFSLLALPTDALTICMIIAVGCMRVSH